MSTSSKLQHAGTAKKVFMFTLSQVSQRGLRIYWTTTQLAKSFRNRTLHAELCPSTRRPNWGRIFNRLPLRMNRSVPRNQSIMTFRNTLQSVASRTFRCSLKAEILLWMTRQLLSRTTHTTRETYKTPRVSSLNLKKALNNQSTNHSHQFRNKTSNRLSKTCPI